MIRSAPELIDRAVTRLLAGQRLGQRIPGFGIFGSGEDVVAVDRPGEGLRRNAWMTWR